MQKEVKTKEGFVSLTCFIPDKERERAKSEERVAGLQGGGGFWSVQRAAEVLGGWRQAVKMIRCCGLVVVAFTTSG